MVVDELLLNRIREIPDKIKENRPLIHMLPNSVTAALCSDGITALGARPFMAKAEEEMEEIMSYVDATVINMGQPDSEKIRVAKKALQYASEYNVPVVFDPVGIGASKYRLEAFKELLNGSWQGIVKGNRSEIAALQSDSLMHHGIDSLGDIELTCVVNGKNVYAVSGKEDVVFDSRRKMSISHENDKEVGITGTGCLTGAVMGCCYAVEKDPYIAALAAFVIMSSALKKAVDVQGYGRRKMALLDALTDICVKPEEILK